MNSLVAVIIPLYKTQLSHLEEIAVKQCFNILSQHKIIALKPKSLSLDLYNFKFNEEVSFDDSYFKDIAGYNNLMLSAEFYERFLEYQFILIYQPDAFVFKDDLVKWCQEGYDYVGAPWLRPAEYPDIFKKIKNKIRKYLHIKNNTKQNNSLIPTSLQFENGVGNGGFSLRRTRRFFEICKNSRDIINQYNNRHEDFFNEDAFWSIEVNRKKKQLNIPNYKKAVFFSIENNYEYGFRLTNGKLPFGCHSWDKHLNFWRPIFKQNGTVI
jgi:hypothetical protein